MRRIYFSVIVAILALSFGLALRAQLPHQVDTWAPRGTSPDNRVGAAFVTLADGRTLIAGGTVDGTATDTVVIYNPADGSFSNAGQLLAARTGHTATLLEDGRVLVAGGTVNDVLSGDLEVFDTAAGTSTLVATMAEVRSGHAAARLSDGTVLIAGGTGTAGVLQSAEIFDPNSGTSSIVASMQSARTGASATTLIDGRVLIAGGNDGNADLASAEIYYALTQYFEPTDTTLSVPRRGHAALLLPNNSSVLIAGGSSNGEGQASADLFLPAQFPDPYSYGMGRFASTAAMAAPRVGAVGAAGLEGYALAIGGGSSDTEAYRFATIKTDKDDYAPGVKAIITGSGWQPDEEVTLLFQEDPAVHDDYVLTITADAEGRIYHDQWAPEWHDVGVRFYLMAIGKGSKRRAQTTFTDNISIAFDNTASAFAWHQTDEVLNGFNVAVGTPGGRYTCTNNPNAAQDCDAVTKIRFTVPGISGFKDVTVSTTGNNVNWPNSISLTFRSDGTGDFLIPPAGMEGKWDVTAELTYSRSAAPAGTFTASATETEFFGVDDTPPVTTITCNNSPCAGTYAADVLVKLNDVDPSAPDTGSGVSNNGGSVDYCIDDSTNDCVPATNYPGNAGFIVTFASGTTAYVRYRSTDDAGNVETTKFQAIVFQAPTFDVTFDATPISDVAGGTTVLSVTIGTDPAVSVTRAQLPRTFADLPSGTNVSYSYESPLGVSVTGQYRWLSTTGTGSAAGQASQAGGPFSVTADSTVTATYKAQHLLTFTLSGVDADFTGNVVTIGGTPIPSTSFVGYSYTQWIDDGDGAPSVSWTDPLTSSVTGKQYDFLNAAPASFTSPVTAPQTMTATYQKQWLLTFNLSGVDGDYTGTVATIGGATKAHTAFLPANSYTQWADDGSTAPGVSWTSELTSSVTGKRYVFQSATPATLNTPVGAPQTMTATYQRQWLLTFNLSGVSADYTGTVVTINGSTVADTSFSSNSHTLWVNHDSPLTVLWEDPLASSVTGKRYDFLGATPLITPVTMAQTLTATYQKQWLLTLNLSGVDSDYMGTVVTINGSPIASTLFSSDSYIDWVNHDSPLVVSWQDPLASSAPGKRYDFLGATAHVTPMLVPQTLTATYQKQWQLTWTQTGLAGTGGNTVVTVDAAAKTLAMLPYSNWYNDGASVSYGFHTPISTDPPSSTQFELTNGGSLPASPINVSGAMTINGDYSTNIYTIQYLSPLDQSEGTDFRLNTGKNGRVIPVKVLLFKNGVAISDTSTVLMKVVGSNCEAGSGADPIDEYADAGASNGNTNLFRWTAPHWTYNLDTRALGLTTNACYRLDVYIGTISGPTAIKASAMRWAIFKPVK